MKRVRGDQFGRRSIAQCVLMMGFPRSGTTWLGTILDSHPRVLYFHEPFSKMILPGMVSFVRRFESDDDFEGCADRLAAAVDPQCNRPPFFHKDYLVWTPAMRGMAWLAARTWPGFRGLFRSMSAPRKGSRFDLVIKDGFGIHIIPLATTLHARTLLIVRHPVDVVRSVLRGQRLGLMQPINRAELLQYYPRRIQEAGVPIEAVNSLSEAEAIALGWVVENAEYLVGTRRLGGMAIQYEELCRDVRTTTEAIFNYLGWEITPQTSRYLAGSRGGSLAASLLQGKHPYFAVYRRPQATQAVSGRDLLSPDGEEAVTRIAGGLWSELAPAGGSLVEK